MTISTDIDVTRLLFRTLKVLEEKLGREATPIVIARANHGVPGDAAQVDENGDEVVEELHVDTDDVHVEKLHAPAVEVPKPDAWVWYADDAKKISLILDGHLVTPLAGGIQAQGSLVPSNIVLLPAVRIRVAIPEQDTFSAVLAEIPSNMTPPPDDFPDWQPWSDDAILDAILALRRTVTMTAWRYNR